jgi:ribosomal protein S18 acetylase RimI-like enzyme
LQLMVTSNNEPAIRFYEQLGFTRRGRTVIKYHMSRPIP